MSFRVRRYGSRKVVSRNIQENLLLSRHTIYQVTLDIEFFKPVGSALVDLQFIYENQYED